MSAIRKIILFILILTPFYTVSSEPLIHILQKGETLYGLSRKYDVSVKDIMSVNGITKPESVRDGTKLIIPSQKNLQNTVNGSYNSNVISEYIAVKGDTYYGIARKFGMTVPELLALNGLASVDTLMPGRRLKVAGPDERHTSTSTAQDKTQRRDKNDDQPATNLNVRYGGGYDWPVEGKRDLMDGKLCGIKISARGSDYVVSVSSGTVVWTGPYRGFGNVILINSHGYIYMYGGNEDIFVNVGESVSNGTRIGRLGPAGNRNEEKEMYFSVFKDGKPVEVSEAPRN